MVINDGKMSPEDIKKMIANLNEGGSDPSMVYIDEWQLHCAALCNYLRAAGIDVTPMLQSLVDQLPQVAGMPSMKSTEKVT